MASKFYGANVGAALGGSVSKSGTTTSRSIELQVVYTAAGMSKTAVLNGLEAIKNAVLMDTWPPA